MTRNSFHEGLITEDSHCGARKRGLFDALRCCLPLNHEGPHNFVVSGVVPYGEDGRGARKRDWGTLKKRIRRDRDGPANL